MRDYRRENAEFVYYSDVTVVCRQNRQDDSFQDEPAVIVEVVSESTRRTDEGEKRDAYLTIPTLGAYVLLEQSAPAALVYERRGGSEPGFRRVVISGGDAIIRLEGVGIELPLSEVYEGIEFTEGAE